MCTNVVVRLRLRRPGNRRKMIDEPEPVRCENCDLPQPECQCEVKVFIYDDDDPAF